MLLKFVAGLLAWLTPIQSSGDHPGLLTRGGEPHAGKVRYLTARQEKDD